MRKHRRPLRRNVDSSRLNRLVAEVERCEERLLLAATPVEIRNALDLPTSVVVSYTGNTQAVQARVLNSTGGLLGFPSGADGDFLMLSTGIASWIDTVANTSGSQGTDLPPSGVSGDSATISFTIAVPPANGTQKFKFDFIFMSDEYPEWVGSSFNDTFTATINGTNVALDQFGNPVSVNNVFFTGAAATGTFFDGRSSKLTASYTVAEGTTSLDVVLNIKDLGDGIYDSAVLLDNFRFEEPQVVFLDFDGGSLTNFLGAGTTLTLPAFSAADVKSADSTASVIASIVSGLNTLYSGYDISFVTTAPTSGKFMTAIIGGDNGATVTMTNPLDKAKFGGASTTTVTNYMGLAGTLFGRAERVDIGNLFRDDRAVIFSGVFDNFYAAEDSATILKRLIVTTAHEIGHNLGLRHISNTFNEDVMKKNSPRSPDAVFGTELRALAEVWGDNATTQNDDQYLKSVLGPRGGGSFLGLSFNFSELFKIFTIKLPTIKLFDVSVGFYDQGGEINPSDGDEDEEKMGVIFTDLDTTNGFLQIAVPTFMDDPAMFIYGASKEGGPLDFFTGTPDGKNLDPEDSLLDVFDDEGNFIGNFSFAKGAPGKLKDAGTASAFENQFLNVQFLTKNKGAFTDADGDTMTVALKGGGLLGGIFEQETGNLLDLVVQQTTAKSTLGMKVKPTGDGAFDLGGILGDANSSLVSILGKLVDLNGTGIDIKKGVGTVNLRNLENGADIKIGGVEGATTNIVLNDVGEGSDITVGNNVGDLMANNVMGSAIRVTGNVGHAEVTRFVNSHLWAGFNPFNVANPLAGGTFLSDQTIDEFFATGDDPANPAFVNSTVVAATVNLVGIHTLPEGGLNGGTPFGVGVSNAQPNAALEVVSLSPAFDYEAGVTETLGDFRVVRL